MSADQSPLLHIPGKAAPLLLSVGGDETDPSRASRNAIWLHGNTQVWTATILPSQGSTTMNRSMVSPTLPAHYRPRRSTSSSAAPELDPSLEGVIERSLRIHEIHSLQLDLEVLALPQQRMPIGSCEAAQLIAPQFQHLET